MVITCSQKYKIRDGVKIHKTDEKILSYIRCKALEAKWSLKLLELVTKKFGGFNSWNDVFLTYFNEPGHPIREAIK